MLAICLLDSPSLVAAGAQMVPDAVSGVYRIGVASEPWELTGYARLRRQVFCQEQALFDVSDQDEHDADAIPIVARSYAAGMADEVVGAVRIHEQSPGVWFGSRLAVEPGWRGVSGLAAGLIRSAVALATARGCTTFLATVQRQNVPLFRRLHWQTLSSVEVRGRPHCLMQATLRPLRESRTPTGGPAFA